MLTKNIAESCPPSRILSPCTVLLHCEDLIFRTKHLNCCDGDICEIAWYRSGGAPSVKNSRGSGMYDDGEVSLQQPPTDPGDQMLEDSEDMLQDADALVSNRYADILLGVNHMLSIPEYVAMVLS